MNTLKLLAIQCALIFLCLTSTSAQFIQLGQDIDGEAAFDNSGTSVSMAANGNRIAIGAPGNDGNGNSSGHVRVFDWNGASWVQLGQDIDGENTAFGISGFSVSLSENGNRVAIGAPQNNDNGNNSGHVRVYDWNGANWVQLGQDIDGEAAFDFSGWSLEDDHVYINATIRNASKIDSSNVQTIPLDYFMIEEHIEYLHDIELMDDGKTVVTYYDTVYTFENWE